MAKMPDLNARKDAPPKRFLSVRVYRHYGAVDIEFGVSAEYSPVDAHDQQRYWLNLETQVMAMHDEWAKNKLPYVKPLEQDKR